MGKLPRNTKYGYRATVKVGYIAWYKELTGDTPDVAFHDKQVVFTNTDEPVEGYYDVCVSHSQLGARIPARFIEFY